MKKIFFALLVLGTALFASCVQEKSFETIPVGENSVAFVMQGSSTRSGEESAAPVTRGITIQMKGIEDENLYLEETIEELNPIPATRGIPAYTENVGSVYKNNLGVHVVGGNFGADAKFWNMDDKAYEGGNNGWRYQYDYDGNPWPKDKGEAVKFYLRMPYEGSGVSNLTYPSEGTTSFKLVSPTEGSAQQDLLFGYTSISKNQHDGYLPAGAPVTMYHALTGIKFSNGHPNDNETKTIITKVEIIGLAGSGTATVSSTGVVQWTGLDGYSTETSPFYVRFDNPTYDKDAGARNSDGTVSTTGNKQWNSDFGSSWTSAAADHNLNESDGSLTFWFIPQEMTNDVILKVYFTVKTPDSVNGFHNDACHEIALGSLLNEAYTGAGKEGNLKWEAGQLRTYTLKPFDVDVEIEDSITATVKSNLHVANTGNVDEYVRMMVIGNWYGWKSQESKEAGDDPCILVGYQYQSKALATEAGHPEDPMVLPWYGGGYPCRVPGDASTIDLSLDVPGYDGPRVDPYGSFDSSFTLAKLSDARDGKRNDWADASGGYYFTMPIGPGDILDASTAGTKDLFNTYTLNGTVPTIYVATNGTQRTAAYGVHLVMEIAVQAIKVPTEIVNGVEKPVWWLQAWYDATGIKKLNPEYVDDDGVSINEKFVTYYENGEYEPSQN